MRTELFVQTAFEQNTRIVSCTDTGKAICIDPGEPSEDTANYITENGLDLTAVIATHGHLDHIGGAAFMHERFPDAEVLVHKAEEELYYALPRQPLAMGIQPHQLAALGMDYDEPPKITRNVEHGEVLEIGNVKLEVRHCPGHTLGHIVLVAHKEGRCSQETAFFRERLDAPTCRAVTMANSSNRSRLMCFHWTTISWFAAGTGRTRRSAGNV
jgi:glyoxylase-like metal-dependent hydrolase (beta-lactamase superfamily II)